MLYDFSRVDAYALCSRPFTFEAACAQAFESRKSAVIRQHGSGQSMPHVGIAEGTSAATADAVLKLSVGAQKFALAGNDVSFSRGVRKFLQIRLQKPRWEWFGHVESCWT
jgi:hypothetical protein